MRKFNIAVIQLDTQNDKKKNLEKAAEFIKEAVSKNAKIISFPEDGTVHQSCRKYGEA